jgi:hypothetical protein
LCVSESWTSSGLWCVVWCGVVVSCNEYFGTSWLLSMRRIGCPEITTTNHAVAQQTAVPPTSRRKHQITNNNISLPSPLLHPSYCIYRYNTFYFVLCRAAVRTCRFGWIFYINFLRIYFLCAFTTLRMATVNFVCLSVSLSVYPLSWKNKTPLMDGILLY